GLAPSLPYIPDANNLSVQSPSTLTIDAGACLKFERDAAIFVTSGAVLSAPGNAGTHVTFSSIADDGACNTDTNGAPTAPQQGDWRRVDVSGQASFSYADFKYGGGTDLNLGMLALQGGSSLTALDNSSLTRSQSAGIWIDSSSNTVGPSNAIHDNTGNG